jgi:hypothetical protein
VSSRLLLLLLSRGAACKQPMRVRTGGPLRKAKSVSCKFTVQVSSHCS